MDIKKCDLCKKEIKNREYISVGFDICEWAEFCQNCALPVFKFLRKNKFVDKNNKKIKD
jgi:hypothetical protein